MKAVAECRVVNEDLQLLLVDNAGVWWIPGGQVEPGESPSSCAVREVLEETGVQVSIVDCLAVCVRAEQDAVYFTFSAVKIGAGDSMVGVNTDEKVRQARWVDPYEASQLLPDHPTKRVLLHGRSEHLLFETSSPPGLQGTQRERLATW